VERANQELLEAWAGGDYDAGHCLFERHFATVRRFFRNKVGAELEDLVQQTFLGCLEARARYRGEANFKTFILSIARNQLYSHYRRVTKRADLDFSVQSIEDMGTSPSGVIARHQKERALEMALRSVPLDMQIAVELAYWHELSPSEIATVLDVPLNTVYSRLRRARLLLRDLMQPDCF
jgi:RNA polymerase sigma-70 factor (ECF subfamily)